MGQSGAKYVPNILNFIEDPTIILSLRVETAIALSKIGESGDKYIPEILNFIQNKTVDLSVRRSAAEALINIQKLNLNEVVFILNNVYEANRYSFKQWRFLTYVLSGGTDKVKTLMKWIGSPKLPIIGYSQSTPTSLNYEDGKKTLELFLQVWNNAQELPRLQQDLAEKITVVTSLVSWKSQDIDLLQRHFNNLKAGNFSQADTLESVILNLKK